MSENILKALMQLFALISDVESGNVKGRNIVQAFLKLQLTSELVEQYLKVYDDFIDSIHNLSDKERARKRVSLNSVKVLRICTQINQELTQAQKMVVLIRLIEYITVNGKERGGANEQELEFLDTVASTFNIENQEYKNCYHLVTAAAEEKPHDERFLVISSEPMSGIRSLLSETLQGQIRVLHIQSVNMYVLRYYGHMDIYLNGQTLSPEKIHLFTPGSSIRSTKLQPIYYSDVTGSFMSGSDAAGINFTVNELEYKFKSGKTGLHKLSFKEENGTLVGIMGGSGAGKSTVLNVLNGNENPFSGEVLINGINIHHDKKKIEGVIGMVPQDDLLIEELTVFQNLFYAGKLCFDHLSDEEIEKLVYAVLASLGLSETAQLKVGSPLEKTISGGQRKRLNIGLELIREPSVMFVDEPTSGLSSRDSENIMDLLKELTLKGKLVFVVIHQPSSDIFKMFDKLLILDLGGYPIYYGNPVDAVMYFKKAINHANANESECLTCGNVNPEQIFNIIESKVLDDYGNLTPNRKIAPKEWNQLYHKEINLQPQVTPPSPIPASTFKIPGKIKQFFVFTTRDVLSKLTNKQYMVINFFETPILAFILAFMVRYFDESVSNTYGYKFSENENIPAYILMAVIIALFVGLTVSAEEIIRDRKILKRESFLNLSRSSYLFSKIAIMFTISAIQTFTFVLVGNNLLGVNGLFTDYWFVLFSTSCFANMLGLNISSSFNSAVTIYILIPFLIIPQLILSGVIVKFDKLNPAVTSQTQVPISGELMTSRWAYEALAVNQFMNNAYESQFYKFDKKMSIAAYRKDIWVGDLEAKLSFCYNHADEVDQRKTVDYNFQVLRNELSDFNNNPSTVFKYDNPSEITFENYNETLNKKVEDFLKKVKNHYTKLWNQQNNKRNKIISLAESKSGGKEAFYELEYRNNNENLKELVIAKSLSGKLFVEIDGRLVQKIDPIYKDPPHQSFIRAHFFAPRKSIFGTYYDTYWVNAGVIWFMTLVLGFTLYFDLLKKFLDSSSALLGKVFPSRKK